MKLSLNYSYFFNYYSTLVSLDSSHGCYQNYVDTVNFPTGMQSEMTSVIYVKGEKEDTTK